MEIAIMRTQLLLRAHWIAMETNAILIPYELSKSAKVQICTTNTSGQLAWNKLSMQMPRRSFTGRDLQIPLAQIHCCPTPQRHAAKVSKTLSLRDLRPTCMIKSECCIQLQLSVVLRWVCSFVTSTTLRVLMSIRKDIIGPPTIA